MYVFDHMNTDPYKEDDPPCNLVWMSQTLPDVRTPPSHKTAEGTEETKDEA